MSTDSGKLRLSEKLGYGFGDFASCMFWGSISFYLLYFYTDVFGIPGTAAGIMFLVTRGWDLLIDLVVGVAADRTKTRFGKFRPYLLWVPVPLGIVAVLTYTTPELSVTGKIIYAYVTYGLFWMLYSAVNVPYAALLGVMTSNPKERTALGSYRMIGAYVGITVITASSYALFYYFSVKDSTLGQVVNTTIASFTSAFKAGTTQGPAVQQSVITVAGYQKAMMVYASLAVVLFLGTFALTRERVTPVKDKSQTVRKDLLDLIRNRPWLILVAATVCMNLFSGVRSSMVVYYFRYYVHNEPMQASFLAIGAVANIFGVYAIQYIAPYVGKKRSFIISLVLVGLISLLFYRLEPTDSRAMFAYQVLISLLSGPPTALLWAMYADAADYSELKTGRRATGLIFSASGMCQKLGAALSSAIPAFALVYYHYVPNTEQAPETQAGIRLLISVVPAVCCVGAITMASFYPLNEKRVREIEVDLKAARAAREAIAAP